MLDIGMPELIVILIIAFLIFGAGKLPEIGEGLGKAIRGFRKALSEPEPPKKPSAEKELLKPQEKEKS